MSIRLFIAAAACFAFAAFAQSQPTSKSQAEINAERVGAPSIDKAELCDAEMLVRGAPRYPPDALRYRTEGWALVSYDLDGSGKAVNITLVRSNPSGVFERATIDVFVRTKFVVGAARAGCKSLVMYTLG